MIQDRHFILLGQKFTRRERDVWRLLADNETTQGAAMTLGVSPKTVEYYRDRLYTKLHMRGYAALTRLAIRAGLIKP